MDFLVTCLGTAAALWAAFLLSRQVFMQARSMERPLPVAFCEHTAAEDGWSDFTLILRNRADTPFRLTMIQLEADAFDALVADGARPIGETVVVVAADGTATRGPAAGVSLRCAPLGDPGANATFTFRAHWRSPRALRSARIFLFMRWSDSAIQTFAMQVSIVSAD